MRDFASIASERLCIRSGEEKMEVAERVRKKFDDLLYKYVLQ